ncbi:hypothetical protein L3Y34_019379 [Caenorhabditis briggsae]|uniref:Uncharacterized protein n=1 Tax=Caenorhabditis briggsae TaxID=6238 RepID=A0AAE9DNI2_CAEBR|nr:hypothetical protein L3Y34_019379 [Caenorhabditis briggsae]
MLHRPKPIPMCLFEAYFDKDVPDLFQQNLRISESGYSTTMSSVVVIIEGDGPSAFKQRPPSAVIRREMFKLLLPELVRKYAILGLYPVLSKGSVRLALRPTPRGSSPTSSGSIVAGSAEQRIFKMPGPEILQAVWPHLVRESAIHGLIPVLSNGSVGFVPRSVPYGSSFEGLAAEKIEAAFSRQSEPCSVLDCMAGNTVSFK